MTRVGLGFAAVLIVAGLGCDGESGMDAGEGVDAAMTDGGGGPTDAGFDAGSDAGMEMTDAGPGMDSGTDAGSDAGTDAGPPACALPMQAPLSIPDDVSARLSGASMNMSTTCTSATGTGGPEHVYPLTVTSTVGVEIVGDASFDIAVAVRAACADALSEVACERSYSAGPPPGEPAAATARVVLDPGTYYVVVDTLGFGVGGDYTLTVAEFTPPTNSTCAAATPVTGGTALAGQDLDLSASSPATCMAAAGNALYYSIDVPDGMALVVSTPPPAVPGTEPDIEVLDGCASPMCLASSGTTFPREASYVNTSGSTQSVIVALRGSGMQDVTFDLVTIPTNVTCASPTVVTDGTILRGQRAEFGSTSPAACFTGIDGDATYETLFYSVDVPAGQLLGVTASPTGPFGTLALSLLDGCAAGATCLESGGAFPPAPGAEGELEAFWENTSGSAATVIIAVASQGGEAFDLAVSVGAPPANTACGMATTVMDGTSLPVEFAGTATDTLETACMATATAPVLYYAATIPAGETLTVGSTANGMGATTAVRVLTACRATSCLANGTNGAVFTNTRRTPRDVIIAVGIEPDAFPPPGGTLPSSFALDVTIGFPPYTESTTPTSCTDMTTGTVLPGVTSDDSVSATTALPFAFEFFGAPVTHYSVNSNGLMQMWGSASDVGQTTFTNVAIPNATNPNSFIAPFWDDLFPGTVRTLTTGTAPNRVFTVQWTTFSLFRDRSASLTFQVQLSETSNVIETHYCTLTPGTMDAAGVNGSSATVGLENGAGTVGTSHSFDTAASVNTTDALRFTPR
ncbi:MAG: hypothetical protein H6719_34855 [Sandaracinaceae bacterium]|nr:hypothetical protein [Sandaracinaceae bacterium]